jgi:hypothetical protein
VYSTSFSPTRINSFAELQSLYTKNCRGSYSRKKGEMSPDNDSINRLRGESD